MTTEKQTPTDYGLKIAKLVKERDALADRIKELESTIAELHKYYGEGGTREQARNEGTEIAAKMLLRLTKEPQEGKFTGVMQEAAEAIGKLRSENKKAKEVIRSMAEWINQNNTYHCGECPVDYNECYYSRIKDGKLINCSEHILRHFGWKDGE